MIEVNTLVAFYSRYGWAEKLALAAGVGGIQARANVRIRRLRDHADQAEIDRDASWKENLARMTPEYIAPRDVDAQWADVFLVAAPTQETGGFQGDPLVEMEKYLQSFESFKEIGGTSGKIAAILTGAGALYAAAALAGFTVVPPPSNLSDPLSATAFGRRVSEMARILKSANLAPTQK